MENIVIFGAGQLGDMAIERYGKDNIVRIIDNSPNKVGSQRHGIPIIYLDQFLREKTGNEIILICATWKHTMEIMDQLSSCGITEYKVFTPQLFEDTDLVMNQYEQFEGTSEEVWDKQIIEDGRREYIRKFVDDIKDQIPLFHEIEIETINRCNGICGFCPVNINRDIRKEQFMEESLFFKIIGELEELGFAGRVALFSNNEPLLDDRLIPFSKYTREHLPDAQIHLFTNGTLLTLDKFLELIPYLDELIIDNYNQQLQFIPMVKEIKEYIEGIKDPTLRKKVKILLRKPNEILSSRGGDAPNRNHVMDVCNETCALPFCQMVVRPSGEVSLCCNDPYGKITLGNLNKETIREVWYGEDYREVRRKLLKGRENLEHCKNCDTFMTI